jgi:hypothetical protein
MTLHGSVHHSLTPKYQRRFFHTTSVVRQDTHHLDSNGFILPTILERRRTFLTENSLLQDKSFFQGHTVYGNQHLYDIDQIDINGKTNFVRMLNGYCPVGKDGKDCVVIHHFDQTHMSDWVILLESFHKKFDKKLHSHVHLMNGVVRCEFEQERSAYWQYIASTHLATKFNKLTIF